MAKKIKDKSNKKSAAAGAGAAGAESVVANPRLVEALRASDAAKSEYKSRLVAVAEVCQEEQLSRAEIVASIMEAHDVVKATAESQYSRIKGLLSDPEVLQDLKDGKIDLKTAREKTTKKQKAPSKEIKAANLEKRFAKATTQIVECAKEGGMDLASVLGAIKAALKKGGVR